MLLIKDSLKFADDIEKVSELEWYLSIRTFADNTNRIPTDDGVDKQMSIDDFHKYWLALKTPEWEDKDLIAIYAPFNETLVLDGGEDVLIPLGFVLPANALWVQDELQHGLVFSTSIFAGTANAKGTLLRITNISNERRMLELTKGGLIAHIYIASEPTEEDDTCFVRLCLNENLGEDSNFVLFFPGIYDARDMEMNVEYMNACYVSAAEAKDGRIEFYIQKKLTEKKNPLRDPVLASITVNDTMEYMIRGYDEDAIDIEGAYKKFFREKYEQMSGGENIPNKRYLL